MMEQTGPKICRKLVDVSFCTSRERARESEREQTHLLVDDLHARLAPGEDRRLDVEPAVVLLPLLAARDDRRALLGAGRDVAEDLVALQAADERAERGRLVEGLHDDALEESATPSDCKSPREREGTHVANGAGSCLLGELLDESVVHVLRERGSSASQSCPRTATASERQEGEGAYLVHKDPRARRAVLARVVEDAERAPVGRLLEVGRGEDERGGLAAELERDLSLRRVSRVHLRREGAGRERGRTFLRFDLAAASMILLPVATEPVNATLSILACSAMAAPAVAPSPGTTLTTPAG